MDSWQLFMERVELVDGVLVWKEWDSTHAPQRARFGKPCGTNTLWRGAKGYEKRPYLNVTIRHQKKTYTQRVHRLVYALATGEDIAGKVIDHINGDTLDNRIENLRATDHAGNQRNRVLKQVGASGHVGIYKNPKITGKRGGKPYHVQIMVDHKTKYLGTYSTLSEAIDVRRQAERHYGFTGRR